MPMQTSMPGGAAAAKPLHATESDAATNSPACLPDTGFLRQRLKPDAPIESRVMGGDR